MPPPADSLFALPAGPRFFALVPCAGSGLRAGAIGASSGLAKQYQPVAGRPMVLHTLAAFAGVSRLAAALVVVAPGDCFFDSVRDPAFTVADCGGSSRAASVRRGLAALAGQGALADDWVLVHDAARCLITSDQINRLIDACQHDAVGGLLALALPDTLKQAAAGRAVSTLNRGDKWLAQTPQMFRHGLLVKALDAAGVDAVTDESGAVEALGLQPLVVAGSAQNFKVTYPDDFALAEAVLRYRADHC